MKAGPARPRDPRLDFFRGLALFIIVISHAPANPWAAFTPGRWGFSDATEIFVFCSGVASALAFGATFTSRNWWLGTARILYRVWQVYWAHIGAFVGIAALMVALNATGLPRDYVAQLNLTPFFRDPQANLVGLLTLTYVPNYFDILPMYLVILAMVPVVVALARLHLGLVAAVVAALWLIANSGGLRLPAEPWSERAWFFNPFGWQLVFFTGFALAAGWLRPPPVHPLLVAVAVTVVVCAVPLANGPLRAAVPELDAAGEALRPLTAKTPLGLLRFVHFLSLAYLAWIVVGPMGARLAEGRLRPRIVAVIRTVGQQSLAVFVVGLALSRLMGVAFDILGRNAVTAALVNLAGIAIVIATAYAMAWIKAAPWSEAPEKTAVPAPAGVPGPGIAVWAVIRETLRLDAAPAEPESRRSAPGR